MDRSFANLHDTTDTTIRKSRTANVTLTVMTDGKPAANREITIEQVNHAFLFGANGFKILPLANGELEGVMKDRTEIYGRLFLDIFNFVTLPFYWGGFEPEKGKPDTDRLLKSADWFAEHGCVVKGHPLCWHTLCADWLKEMNNTDILRAQTERIQREVAGFEGLIDMWDVVNEAVIMPIFDKYDNGITRICRELGRIKTIRTMFETARASNPSATLILNDFDYSIAYEILIEGCLEAGIKIDVIGIQSHMHQGYWGVEKTREILDRFARFNLPIHFSETSIISGKLMPPEIADLNDYQVIEWPSTPDGEERQAREVLLHYKTLFAHPLVEGITWWDFPDNEWLKAPSGLIRADYTLKPAYSELRKLIKDEWWGKPTTLVTDNEGRVRFNAFTGLYTLIAGLTQTKFNIDMRGSVEMTVTV
jgi:endo-1,4-beta-xylanase